MGLAKEEPSGAHIYIIRARAEAHRGALCRSRLRRIHKNSGGGPDLTPPCTPFTEIKLCNNCINEQFILGKRSTLFFEKRKIQQKIYNTKTSLSNILQ